MFCEILSRSNNLLRRVLTHKTFRKSPVTLSLSGNFNDSNRGKRSICHMSSSANIPMREISIPIPYGQVSAKVWGQDTGQPVLALHGWMDNCGTFDRLVPLLDNSLCIVAMDFPGHGLSSHKPPGCFYEHLDMIFAIRYVTKHLNWKKFNLIGHSMGGELAQTYSAFYPEVIEKLVVIDIVKSISFASEKIPEIIIKAMNVNMDVESKLTQKAPVYSIESAKERLIKGMHGEITPESADTLLKRGTRLSECGNGYVFTRDLRLRTIEYFNAISHDTSQSLLSRIRSEMLLIRANNTNPNYISPSLDFDLTFLDMFRQNCKRFVLETVDGNHFVHINNPERVAPLINEFLLSH